MNNLSLREKAIIYILFLVVIALLAYLFGIRTLNNANADMQIQLQELQARKEQLDVLKQENQKTQGAIETLKSDIVKYEQSFISEMKTENLEKYVLDEFEKAGMPFLADVKSEDVQMEAIVLSMTKKERANPKLLNPQRKHRIAKGAGVDIAVVNRFIKQFEQTQKMMKQMPGLMGGKKRGPFGGFSGFKMPF